MKTITVFTPTYNRAHLLSRLYESLLRQTCQDFIWLVVDDGSNDGTRELVAGWQAEGRIEIQYEYKANGGMHTAHNLAYDLIETELNTCIDSDDWMPDDAVQMILSRWGTVSDDPAVAGIVGLDETPDGDIIGTNLPADGTRCTLSGLYAHMHVRGDKKLVYRSS
ncbi:glycosyltransferase family 2 protein, partial [Luteimonas changyuni]|uniref:glycosyltransferase family 2 protein n=1 Tax=Luteimonas sp. MJ145 TaxID=3129234 RepID=UPI0031BB4E22